MGPDVKGSPAFAPEAESDREEAARARGRHADYNRTRLRALLAVTL